MAEEIRLNGLAIAPGVLETIAVQAAQKVDGVVSVEGGGQGLAGLVKSGAKEIEVAVADDGTLSATMHVTMRYSTPLYQQAAAIQAAVTEALESMTGQKVEAVDVYVDGVSFED